VVSSTEAFRRVEVPAHQVELPTTSVMASNPDPPMGEECLKPDLDKAMGEGARSLDLKAARILPEAVAATWKVHWLWEILPMTSWEPVYSKNPVTQQRSSHV
jgi:hypothetical protein